MKRTKEWFEDAVKAHSKKLYTYAYWLAKDKDVAKDLVQEALLRAYKAREQIKDDAAVKAWMLTIVRREFARFCEKAEKMRSVELDEERVAANESVDEISNWALKRALRELNNDYKEPLLMQVVMGLTIKEIAAELDLTQEAATTRLFRARQKLKEILIEAPKTKRMNP